MKDVVLIDAGTGNLRSVQKALEAVAPMLSALTTLRKFEQENV